MPLLDNSFKKHKVIYTCSQCTFSAYLYYSRIGWHWRIAKHRKNILGSGKMWWCWWDYYVGCIFFLRRMFRVCWKPSSSAPGSSITCADTLKCVHIKQLKHIHHIVFRMMHPSTCAGAKSINSGMKSIPFKWGKRLSAMLTLCVIYNRSYHFSLWLRFTRIQVWPTMCQP